MIGEYLFEDFRETAYLRIIRSHGFFCLTYPNMQTGYHIHSLYNERCDNEGVPSRCAYVRDLNIELLPVGI